MWSRLSSTEGNADPHQTKTHTCASHRLVILIIGDNGASGEGSLKGLANEVRTLLMLLHAPTEIDTCMHTRLTINQSISDHPFTRTRTHPTLNTQMCFFNNIPEDFSKVDIDEIGSQDTYNHFPVGACGNTSCVGRSIGQG